MRTTVTRLKGGAAFAAAFVLLALLCPSEARAQWAADGNNISSTNTGNVGIGTGAGANAPTARLDVRQPDGTNGVNMFVMTSRGNSNADVGQFLMRHTDASAARWNTAVVRWETTTGLDGKLSFFTAQDGTNTQVRRMAIDGFGRVGIGTPSPESLLHVNNDGGLGVIRLSGLGAAAMTFKDAGAPADRKQYQWRSEGGVFRMALVDDSGGAFVRQNILTANSSGNVGIGTASPSANLHVESPSGGDSVLKVSTAGTESPARLALVDVSAGGQYARSSLNLTGRHSSIGSVDDNDVTAGLLLKDSQSGQHFRLGLRPYTNSLNLFSDGLAGGGGVMTWLRTGQVGVGTPSPAYRLDVQGGAVNASGGLCIAGDCKTSWAAVGGGGQWASSGTSLLYNAGGVGIGTQAADSAKLVIGGAAGAEGLDLATSDQYANLRVIRNSRGSSDRDLYLQYQAGAGSKIHFYTDNAEVMTLAGGKLGVGAGATNPAHTLEVAGTIHASGAITGETISATFQDVAEWVPSVQKLSAGTVVALDRAKTNHVLASSKAYDTRVAGVVSAQPGVILGVGGEGKLKVATTGRVKVRVDATRGAVEVGDLLVTSDVEGVAMKSVPVELGGVQMHRPGTIIGKALEPLEKGTGEILVLLSLQ